MSESSNDSSSSHNHGSKLPKLIVKTKSHNYGEWSIQSEIQLVGRGLWKYVVGPESIPPVIPPLREPFIQQGKDKSGAQSEVEVAGNAAERQKAINDAKPWTEKNDLTRAIICQALANRQLHLVKHLPYASQIWQELRRKFLKPDSSISNSKKTSLLTYLCTSDMDVLTWLDDMQRLYEDLTDMDPTAFSDEDFALLLTSNLPETAEWRSLAGTLRNRVKECNRAQPPIPITSMEFIESITDEYYFRNKNNPETMAQVFTARFDANKVANRNSKRNRASGTTDPSTNPSPKRPRTQKICTNINCSKRGHEISDCFAYGGGKQGNYATWWTGPWNIHLPPSQRKDQKPAVSSSQANLLTADSTTVASTSQLADSTDPGLFTPAITYTDAGEPPNLVFATFDDTSPVVATVPILHNAMPKSDTCIYDSGANRHVFNDRAVFETYEHIQPLSVQAFGDKLSTTAIGRGSVRLRSRFGIRPSSFLLTNVLHIPQAHSNLISGAQLAQHGVVTTLGKQNAILTHNGVFIMSGYVERGMYHLDTKPIRPSPSLLSRISPMVASLDSNQSGFYTA